ncbi:LicD family protein, partial [Streptococcus pneumoniae]
SLFAKEVMPVEIWGEGVEKPFEDAFFKVPTEYDRYLKRLYGENYLHEEPSDDEKKSHLGGQ